MGLAASSDLMAPGQDLGKGTAMYGKILRGAISAAALIVAGPAAGCSYLEAFTVEQIRFADLVILGKVTSYEVIDTPIGAALVTLEVTERLKGEVPDQVTFLWQGGSAFGPPPELPTGLTVIAGAFVVGSSMRTSDFSPSDLRPDLPMIGQPYCGQGSLQEAVPQLVADVRSMLAP
jgi:hypothetical protein